MESVHEEGVDRAQSVKYLLCNHKDLSGNTTPQHPCRKLGALSDKMAQWVTTPALGRQRGLTPGTCWPAALTELMNL